MRQLIGAFLSNESGFGRFMTRCGIIVAANLMFILFSLPLVTGGAALAAMYHVMLKTLRGDGEINPFKQFWTGFRTNFKQATIAWLLAAALAFLGYLEVGICRQATGFVSAMQYGLYGMGILLVILLVHLFPVMAAFDNTLFALVRSSLYFAFQRPWRLIVVLFFNVFPLYLTFTDAQTLPLYAFLWFFFGFGAIAMLTASLLVKDFAKYLPVVDDYGDFILTEDGEKILPGSPEEKAYFDGGGGSDGSFAMSEEEILEEMKKLGM